MAHSCVAPTVSGTVVSAVGEGHLRGTSSGPDQGPSNLVGGSLTNLKTGRMRQGQLEMDNGNARDRPGELHRGI